MAEIGKKSVGRAFYLVLAVLGFVVYTLIGVVQYDKSFIEALRGALTPFVVLLIIAAVLPWATDKYGRKDKP